MSRFGKLFQQPREDGDGSTEPSTRTQAEGLAEVSNTQTSKILHTQKSELLNTQVDEKKKGRPTGKRSNPDYEQVTAYIKKETYRKVKVALLENDGGDFSGLVQELLEQWLNQS